MSAIITFHTGNLHLCQTPIAELKGRFLCSAVAQLGHNADVLMPEHHALRHLSPRRFSLVHDAVAGTDPGGLDPNDHFARACLRNIGLLHSDLPCAVQRYGLHLMIVHYFSS